MIWTTARLDTGHWNTNTEEARELLVANEFRRKNPGAPIRVLLFDLPMTYYGHIEKPDNWRGNARGAEMVVWKTIVGCQAFNVIAQNPGEVMARR